MLLCSTDQPFSGHWWTGPHEGPMGPTGWTVSADWTIPAGVTTVPVAWNGKVRLAQKGGDGSAVDLAVSTSFNIFQHFITVSLVISAISMFGSQHDWWFLHISGDVRNIPQKFSEFPQHFPSIFRRMACLKKWPVRCICICSENCSWPAACCEERAPSWRWAWKMLGIMGRSWGDDQFFGGFIMGI